MGRQHRRVALVTGANRGIGFEVVRALAGKGYDVWLAARDLELGEAAASAFHDQGLTVHPLQLDVADEASVAAAALRVGNEGGRLDVLVNNAGIAGPEPLPSQLDLDSLRATLNTNLYGAIRATQAFLPLLRRSPAGRIVMVSSDIGSHGRQTDPDFHGYAINPLGYAVSKAALNAVTIAFAKELVGTTIKVNAANPGFTATGLNGFQGFNTVAQGAAPIVALATLPDDGPTGTFLGPDGPEPW